MSHNIYIKIFKPINLQEFMNPTEYPPGTFTQVNASVIHDKNLEISELRSAVKKLSQEVASIHAIAEEQGHDLLNWQVRYASLEKQLTAALESNVTLYSKLKNRIY